MRVNLKGCVREYHSLQDEYRDLMRDYNELMKERNEFFRKINKSSSNYDSDLNKNDINDILMLCHPDRHGNSARATRVTRKLIIIKKR